MWDDDGEDDCDDDDADAEGETPELELTVKGPDRGKLGLGLALDGMREGTPL